MSFSFPPCCTPALPESASTRERLAEQRYCAYNRAGDPATAGLNYQGKPCPTWAELPENIRVKWQAVDGNEHADLRRRAVLTNALLVAHSRGLRGLHGDQDPAIEMSDQDVEQSDMDHYRSEAERLFRTMELAARFPDMKS